MQVFDTPITTNDQSFDRVLATGMPLLLVFLHSPAPEALEQAMHRLARQYAGKLLIVRLPVTDGPETTRRYQISRPPALVAIREGKNISKAEGISAADLEAHAAYLLGTGPQPTAPRPEPTAARPGPQPTPPPYTPREPAVDGRPRVVTDATFNQEVLRSPLPVLVDFWAPWCGPCKMVEPIVARLASEMPDRLRVAKVNVDENPAISMRYDVRSIPTMMIVKNGQIVDRWAGALPEGPLRSRLARVL
jgi:thioredoxin 1